MINFNKNFDAAQFGGLSEKIVCTCHTCQTLPIQNQTLLCQGNEHRDNKWNPEYGCEKKRKNYFS